MAQLPPVATQASGGHPHSSLQLPMPGSGTLAVTLATFTETPLPRVTACRYVASGISSEVRRLHCYPEGVSPSD